MSISGEHVLRPVLRPVFASVLEPDPSLRQFEDWWQPFSEPVRQFPGVSFAAALAASGMAPIDPEILNAA